MSDHSEPRSPTLRHPSGDPFGFFELSQDILLAQQKMMPSGRMFERFSEAAGNVSQAQITYCQALMHANATLFGAMLEGSGPPEARPSVAETNEVTAS
jgi:hypothetical protein